MSTTHTQTDETLTDRLIEFYRTYYRDAIGTLAQRYPSEQQSLTIAYDDLFQYDRQLAADMRTQPEQIREYADDALRLFDLPADVELADAHVRVAGLPDEYTFYPGAFSPTDRAGEYVAVTGEISKTTDVYSKIVEAAFECQRCGTMTYVPQTDRGFQDPHECQGCERDGPFRVNFDQSEFIDAQQLRLATPPEVASGTGQEIDVFCEDDLADTATIGDRVTIAGALHLEQQTSGREKTGKFEPYMDAHAIEIDETDHTDLDIDPDERERIHELAAGDKGDPLDLAAASLAPKVHGYDHIKRMLILAMVGGAKTVYDDEYDESDRGEFHVLLLGDPGTAKSKLLDRVEELGWRTVGVSGKGATKAGTTATAAQDDFGDGEWTLDAGALVKANEGVVCIDELDDMPDEVRAALLEPMSKQSIHINKAGINTRLRTETAVIAAGNPKYGRFDQYEPTGEQFDFGSTLLSRFDLIFTLTDQPDPDRDADIAEHILSARDAAKRQMRGLDVGAAADTIARPVDPDLLRKWIALAKQQPEPVFADAEVQSWLDESFSDLRGMYDYDDDEPVPVTFRKLEAIARIAEAAARFEFSETIELRHAKLAANAVGESMRDYGYDDDGKLDADVVETGTSKSQREAMKTLEATLETLQAETDGNPAVEDVVEQLDADGVAHPHGVIDRAKESGLAYNPQDGKLRWVGGA
jgi:replicative DNA helicase Mcm